MIDNGIAQTISVFEREHFASLDAKYGISDEHDDIDMSDSSLKALDGELHRLHSAIVDGSISLCQPLAPVSDLALGSSLIDRYYS